MIECLIVRNFNGPSGVDSSLDLMKFCFDLHAMVLRDRIGKHILRR